jgi:hypothetical protein
MQLDINNLPKLTPKKYPENKPKKYGDYLIVKEDGKLCIETWNNFEWICHNDSIIAWYDLVIENNIDYMEIYCGIELRKSNNFSYVGRFLDTGSYVFNDPSKDIPRGEFYNIDIISLRDNKIIATTDNEIPLAKISTKTIKEIVRLLNRDLDRYNNYLLILKFLFNKDNGLPLIKDNILISEIDLDD